MSDQRPSLRQRLARATIDVTALRTSPAFRRMFGAQLISSIGTQVTLVALYIQVYQLTGSTFMVGLLALSMVLPTVTLSLVGGAIADSMDRRTLLVMVQVAMAATSGTLVWLATLDHPPLWALYVLAAVTSAFAAIDGPTRTAVIPMLVDEATLRSAVQLREVLTQSGRVFGPLFGGFLVGSFGLPVAYAFDTVSFVVAFLMFLGLPSLVPELRRRFELSSIVEGLRFVGARPVLAATFYADLIAMILGQQRALFPAYATEVFDGGEFVTGLLFAAPAIGALVGTLFLGVFRNVRREGLGVLVAVAMWGLFIALFGLAPWLWLAIVFLALAGAADMVSAVFRQLILVHTVPDELRGRMGAVHIMVVTGGPPVGDFVSGSMGEAIGVRQTSVISGLAVVVGVLGLGARIPQFRTYRHTAGASTSNVIGET